MQTSASSDVERLGPMRSLLLQIKILRGASGAELIELGRAAQIRRFAPDDIIADEADGAPAVCLVAFGRVRLRRFGDRGRELIVDDVEPGGFFGDEALSAATAPRANAVALDEVTLLSISGDAFAAFLAAHPRVAVRLATELSRQLHLARETAARMALLSVEERLVLTLERIAERHGARCADGFLVHTRPTHQELAARIGACRETVTRAWSSLSRRGLIIRRGSGCLVRRAAL